MKKKLFAGILTAAMFLQMLGSTDLVMAEETAFPENSFSTETVTEESTQTEETLEMTDADIQTEEALGITDEGIQVENEADEPLVGSSISGAEAGIYILSLDANGFKAGLVLNSSVPKSNLEYRWLYYDETDATWNVAQDWHAGNEWIDWRPGKYGDYVIQAEVREIGTTEVVTAATGIGYHPEIKGKCQMPYTGAGGGYLIGIESYQNNDYSYEMLILDCTLLAQGKDAWIYTTGQCKTGENAFWTIWQPQYGYYWTLFRVYDAAGNIIDQDCYSFANVTGNGGTVSSQTQTTQPVSTVSKKGIQGFDNAFKSDVSVKHIVENVYLDQLVSFDPNSTYHYDYDGQTHYVTNYAEVLWQKVDAANEQGMEVTFILLMRGNAECASRGMMVAGAGATDSTRLYALNPDNQEVKALMKYMAKTFVTDHPVKHWIIGNEVNMPDAYNYTGTLDLVTNVNIAVGNYLNLYREVQATGVSGIRQYISLDHSWTDNDEGRGIAGKDFLFYFWYRMHEIDSNVEWNIAYHLYAPHMMYSSSIWSNSGLTTNDENSRFICASNLSVLTDYVKLHFGENCRIILSEQGFNYSTEGPRVQAAALAYTFYAAQYNNMVDAVVFRSYRDEGTDGPFDLGLKDSNDSPREAFTVFQYMDTKEGHNCTDSYLEVIGAPNWASIIPNYDGTW